MQRSVSRAAVSVVNVALAAILSLPGQGVSAETVVKDRIEFRPLCEPGCGGAIVSVAVDPRDSKHIISGGDMLGVGVSFDGGDSWQATFGFSSYEMCTPTFHPTKADVVWIGSCMGPYRSEDRGVHWVSMREGMPGVSGSGYTAIVEKVLFDPDQPGRLLAVGGTSRRWNRCDTFGWVWESLDDGAHWKKLAVVGDKGSLQGDVVGANIVWAEYEPGSGSHIQALLDGGAWVESADDGRTWKVHEYQGIVGRLEYVTFSPVQAGVVYATTSSTEAASGGVFKSTDGGKTFTAIEDGLEKVRATPYDPNLTSNYSNVVVSKSDPGVLYVCDRAWNASVIYRSSDGGKRWTPVATKRPVDRKVDVGGLEGAFQVRTATPAGLSLVLAIDPSDAKNVYGFNTEYVLRTRDGGKTWDDATALNPDPAKKDEWRGRGWNGWCSNEVRFNPQNPNQIVVQMMDAGRAWVSDNDGKSWHYANTDAHPWLGGNAVTFGKGGVIYGTTGQFEQVNGISRSRDGGRTWESLAGAERGLPGKGWGSRGTMGGIYCDPERPERVWAVVNGKLMASTDGGEKWVAVSEGAGGGGERKYWWIEGDPTRAGRFYVSGEEGIYVCEDGGLPVAIGGPRPAERGKLHVDARGRLYAAQWRKGPTGVWRYEPGSAGGKGGGKWTRLTDETLAMDVASDPKDPTRIVMVTSQDPFNDLAGGNGVWMSADDGKTWSRHVGGLAMLRANCVEFDPKGGERLLVGTYGRGFFEAVWPRDYRPVGEERGYSVVAGAVVAPDATPGKSGGAGVAGGGHMVQDFMQRGLDYTYGKSWPEGNAVRSDAAGAGGLVIDATEHGGGGIVLGKQDIAPHDETRLVLRLRVMPGNEAERIAVNLIDLPGGTQTMTFMLPAVSEKMSEVSVDLPKLPAGARYTPAQMQIQGTNFSDAARKLRVVIGSVRTAGGKADDDVKVDASPFKAPVKGLPNTPAPGFWADHPAAWQAMFNGQVARAKEGNIDVVLLGDSITQGWGDTSKGRWKTALPGLTTVNFGIGGDTTRQVLYRIEHGLLDGYKAKLVVLKIGTNNLYNDANSGSDEEVADGIKACVKAIREKQPGAKVLVLSVLPRQNGYFIGRINHVNELIKGVGDEKSVYYRDIGGSFKVSETEVKKEYYTGDELHLGEAGYDHFIEVLTPIVRELTR